MRIWFFLFPFFFFLTNLGYGQFTHPPYRQYTLRDGLPQMQVMSLFQDSRGIIWLGTKGGLSSFNGDEFKSYTEKDSLMNGFISQITEDYTGNIWISTRSGLVRFNGKKFTSFPLPELVTLFLSPTPDGKIWYIGGDQKGKTLFGYHENGQYIDLAKKYPEVRWDTQNSIGYDQRTRTVLISNLKALFEVTNDKVLRIDNVPDSLEIIKNDSTVYLFRKNNAKSCTLFEYERGKLIPLAEISNGQSVIHKKINQSIAFISVYEMTRVYSLSKEKFETIPFPELHKNSYLKDSDGHLWLGTEEGFYQVFSSGFETFKKEYLPQVWSITEDLHKNIWFASFDFGLKKYDGKSFKEYTAESLKKYALNFYFQPQLDRLGRIYFPNNLGILYYDGNAFGAIKNLPCLATFYDKKNDLLYGAYRRYVEIYNSRRELIRTIGEKEGVMLKGYISSFGQDKSGKIWMGGLTGLMRYDWVRNQLINFNQSNGKLPCEGVICVYTAPDSITWFGGTDGLLMYDEKSDSVKRIGSSEITEGVNLVSSIDSTWLVFSQPAGIYLMDLEKFRSEKKVVLYLFNERNGFGGLEPGQNGAMKDSKGNIWMTSSTEVVKLNPKELDFRKYKINVRISGFNGKAISFNQDKLVLPKNDRSSVVQFETICFNRPKAANYSWRIEGENMEWSAWQEEDYAVLTNLPDGKSILQVRSKIPGLPEYEASISVPLFASISLWKQHWFFPALLGLILLLVITSLFLLFQARTEMVQINKQARMFQLQAILSQMNPHFIFNVMASLQSMILSANIEKANEYLVKMSNLIRGFLEASVSTSISKSKDMKQNELPLQNALEVIHNYVQFQQLIYPDKFDYELYIDPEIDPVQQTLPPMLIQPFVENAIRHGLLQKAEKGLLRISITKTANGELNIDIEDDGIGIQKAGEMIRRSSLLYTSRGKELTLKRIKLLNELGYNIRFNSLSSENGTKIIITIGYAI